MKKEQPSLLKEKEIGEFVEKLTATKNLQVEKKDFADIISNYDLKGNLKKVVFEYIKKAEELEVKE